MPPKRITVKNCADPMEAAFLRDWLARHGIDVINTAEQMSPWTGRYGLLARGPQLRVIPRDVQRARELLKAPPTCILAAETDDDALPPPPAYTQDDCMQDDAYLRCPNCGSTNIEKRHMSWPVFLLVNLLLLGLPFLLSSPTWICHDCDWDSHR